MTSAGIRKCAFTKRPISPQDKSSVVYTVGMLDENGRYTGESQIVSVCGAIRKSGMADKMLYAEFNNSEN